MTSAQYRFVNLIFSGFRTVEAYRAVYDTEGRSETAIAARAAEAAKEPVVVAKLRELRERLDKQSTLAPGLTREFVVNGVMSLAMNAQKESVQLGALLALGKTVGIDLFREVHVTERRVRTVEDVEQELKARLAELQQQLNGAVTVEGDARRVETQPATRDRRRKPKENPGG